MKKAAIAFILAICLICTFALSACKDTYRYVPLEASVRYLTNIEGETVTLSSGREAISEDIVYQSQSVKTGDILTPPEDAPTRPGYVFSGWAVDKAGSTLYDFTQPVSGSLNLYAKWVRAEGAEEQLDYTEPRLTFTEKIEESTAFSLVGVCNQKISEGSVNLTTAGINRLTAKATDVKEYLNYTRASSTLIKSATYQDGVVSVTYAAGGSDNVINVAVHDVTQDLVVEDSRASSDALKSFETKALRYESGDIASYNVVMGGSSSMENWSTSVEDMNPVTTKNVGIGGSTAYHWLNCLADRLIVPYSPRAVVLYVGINDIINFGQSGKTTGENLIKLFEHIHTRLPDATVHFILINHVPGYYKTYKTHIDTANTAVIEYAASHNYLNIIDAGKCLEKKNGEYSEAYFLTDKLHMSKAGYVLWGAEVKKAVIAKDKELYQ